MALCESVSMCAHIQNDHKKIQIMIKTAALPKSQHRNHFHNDLRSTLLLIRWASFIIKWKVINSWHAY